MTGRWFGGAVAFVGVFFAAAFVGTMTIAVRNDNLLVLGVLLPHFPLSFLLTVIGMRVASTNRGLGE